MKKRSIISFIIVAIIVLLLGVHFGVPYILQAVKPDLVVDNIDALSLYIDDHMEQGQDSISVFVKDMGEKEIVSINENRDCFNGTVISYREVERYNKRFSRLRFKTELSDNYYVCEEIINGTPIDPSNESAVELSNKVKEILAEIITDDMSDYEKELAIHDYIVRNCIYISEEDGGSENGYHAYGALVDGEAVCNGYAEAFMLLAKCSGLKVSMITGNTGDISHAWNLVELDGAWYHVDTTWDDPVPDQGDRINHTYFNVTDQFMISSHEWNMMAYKHCESTVYNYYVYNDTYFSDEKEWKAAAATAILNEQPAIYAAMVNDYEEDTGEMQFVIGTQKVKTVSWVVNGEGREKEVILYLEYFD